MGLVVTLGSSRPDRFSVDFRMLSTIFPLNNLLFNLLISVLHSLVDVVATVVCFVLAGDPKPGSQANRLRSKGNSCRTELDS